MTQCLCCIKNVVSLGSAMLPKLNVVIFSECQVRKLLLLGLIDCNVCCFSARHSLLFYMIMKTKEGDTVKKVIILSVLRDGANE